jgi:glycosyltransferase involved in cell wall biosynthesis
LRDALLSFVVRLSRARQLVFFHGWSHHIESTQNSRAWRALFRNTLCRADQIIVLARDFADELVPLGATRENITVMQTLFDGRIFDGLSRRDDDWINILFMSRIVRKKGVFELIEAMEELCQQQPQVRLVVAGDGPARAEAEALVNKLELSDRVSFPGYIQGEEKAQALLNADIFALPTSYREGCPLALLEAMAAGLPVLITGNGGIVEVVEDGVHGVVMENVSTATVLQGLKDLLADEELLRQMAKTNYEQAWARYEASAVAGRLEDIYERMAQ